VLDLLFAICLYALIFSANTGRSRADGGRAERAIFDDTRADRANDARIDHSRYS